MRNTPTPDWSRRDFNYIAATIRGLGAGPLTAAEVIAAFATTFPANVRHIVESVVGTPPLEDQHEG